MKAQSYSETKRGPNGQWLKGTPQKGGPGRKPLQASGHLFAAARSLVEVSKDAINAVELARQCSPHAVARVVDIALHSDDERTALEACELLLNRGFGLPTQAIAQMNINANDTASPAERQATLREALEKMRSLFTQRERTIEGKQTP